MIIMVNTMLFSPFPNYHHTILGFLEHYTCKKFYQSGLNHVVSYSKNESHNSERQVSWCSTWKLATQKVHCNVICNVYNDEWNTDHRRWLERCLLIRVDDIKNLRIIGPHKYTLREKVFLDKEFAHFAAY